MEIGRIWERNFCFSSLINILLALQNTWVSHHLFLKLRMNSQFFFLHSQAQNAASVIKKNYFFSPKSSYFSWFSENFFFFLFHINIKFQLCLFEWICEKKRESKKRQKKVTQLSADGRYGKEESFFNSSFVKFCANKFKVF